MVGIRKSYCKHREVFPIHKLAVQAWNRNEPRQEVQDRQCQGGGGSHLSHSLQDVGEEVSHGGTQFQRAEGEGRHTQVGILAHQSGFQAGHQSMLE